MLTVFLGSFAYDWNDFWLANFHWTVRNYNELLILYGGSDFYEDPGYYQAIPLSVEKFVLSGKHDYHKYFFYPHFLGTKPAPGSVCRVKPQRRAGQLCHSALLPAKIHFIFQNPALASRALGKHRCFNPLPHVVEQEPQGLQPSHCCAS